MNPAVYATISILIFSTAILDAQSLSKKQLKFIHKKAKSITIDENYQNGNWSSLASKIKGKNIVLIGELNHGSREIFVTRNDLIKYLHEEQGFNVILFEAGIGEMALLDIRKAKYEPDFLTLGFYGIWRTKAFEGLMAYVKSENLSIAGFDVQPGGSSAFNALLTEVATGWNIDTTAYHHLEAEFDQLDEALSNRKTAEFNDLQPKTLRLTEAYQKMSDLLKAYVTEEQDLELSYVLRTIENRIRYLNYRLDFVGDGDWRKRWVARDLMMADNVLWLRKNIFREEKMIVVGHNFHVSKYNEKEETMGEYLKKIYPEEMYTIGIFTGAGQYADNSGRSKEMDAISEDLLDVRHIVDALEERVHFMNLPRRRKARNQWLFEDIAVNNSFVDLNSSRKLKLADSFDGAIFIDKTSMPEKLTFE